MRGHNLTTPGTKVNCAYRGGARFQGQLLSCHRYIFEMNTRLLQTDGKFAPQPDAAMAWFTCDKLCWYPESRTLNSSSRGSSNWIDVGQSFYFCRPSEQECTILLLTQKNPMRLMLLSEEALGEIHELKSAKCMEKCDCTLWPSCTFWC